MTKTSKTTPKARAKRTANTPAKTVAKTVAKTAPASPYLNTKGRSAAYYFGAEYTANPGSSRMEYLDDCASYYGKARYLDLSTEERAEVQQAFYEGCAAEKNNMRKPW
jgi:hypothetical protein